MESPSSPANLLLLTSKEEEAETIVKSLRNAGLAVRGVFTGDLQQLEELTRTHAFELVICCDYDPAIDLDDCMSRYRQLQLEVPLIIVGDVQTEPAALIAAMRAGARDVIEQGDSEHLQLVVTRELADFRNRRVVGLLRERLHECERRARQTMDASGEAVALVQEGVHVQANPAYRELFRFGGEEDLDGYPLLDLITPEEQPNFRQTLRQLESLGEGDSATIDTRCTRADATGFATRMVISRSLLDGELCLRVTVQETGAPSVAGAPIALDADTGLPTRLAFMAELERRIERKGAEAMPVVLVYVGAEIFAKLIQGESLTNGLETVAALGASLREIAPPQAFVGRVCDDGFAMLIDNLTHTEAIDLASRIVEEARLPVPPDMLKSGRRPCSTGIMLVEPGKVSASEALDTVYRDYLFSAAEPDQGLISSSHAAPPTSDSGYHSDFSEESLKFAARIRRALDGDGFQLVYQPIVSLKGDNQENYNVFLRLRDDEERLREAKDFMAAAVQSGRMVAIDRWVIKHSIEELVKQRGQERKINFFVNIAEETLQDEKLLIWICDYLSEYQARGNWLTFQVLEDHARRHAAAYIKLSDGLRKVKCRVALNRFGLGPAPEVLLKNLRTDFVKFAPEFGVGLADDEGKQKRLVEMANVARERGVRSVVTGVEDARTLTVLWTAGIDYVQGNFLQKPLPTIEPA